MREAHGVCALGVAVQGVPENFIVGELTLSLLWHHGQCTLDAIFLHLPSGLGLLAWTGGILILAKGPAIVLHIGP